MPTSLADLDSARCPITRSVELLGDRWSLLIVRDVLGGLRRFDELASHLAISRAVLSSRLAALVEAGLLQRVDYREEGARRRAEYHPTAGGLALVPTLAALIEWGRTHAPGSASLHPVHLDCGASVRVSMTCAQGHPVAGEELTIQVPHDD